MTYNPKKAEVEPRSQEEWLDILLEDGSDYWGDDITEREQTAIRHLYEPFAGRLAELEQKLRAVQLSYRLDSAQFQELDYLGERVGVSRRKSKVATGEVVFSRDTSAPKDYLIESGKIVSTSGADPIKFITTEDVVLSSGTTSVTCDIEAREKGSSGNVAADSIVNIEDTILGVDNVNNRNKTSSGRDREEDENYRNRIRTSIGDLNVTSLRALYLDLINYEYIRGVQPIDNSADQNGSSLDTHQAEIIVDSEPGHEDEISQTIFDNVPMGIDLVNGVNGQATTGSATLPNGQSFTVRYSNPSDVDIYVDVSVVYDSSITKDEVKDAIVEYIGGTKTNGELIYGELAVGEDVLQGEAEFSVRNISGVYDVDSLYLDTSSGPTSTSNISISGNSKSVIDHSNISVTLNSK